MNKKSILISEHNRRKELFYGGTIHTQMFETMRDNSRMETGQMGQTEQENGTKKVLTKSLSRQTFSLSRLTLGSSRQALS